MLYDVNSSVQKWTKFMSKRGGNVNLKPVAKSVIDERAHEPPNI